MAHLLYDMRLKRYLPFYPMLYTGYRNLDVYLHIPFDQMEWMESNKWSFNIACCGFLGFDEQRIWVIIISAIFRKSPTLNSLDKTMATCRNRPKLNKTRSFRIIVHQAVTKAKSVRLRISNYEKDRIDVILPW